MKVQPYYASQRRFTLASGWLLPGNLGGIADRLLLAGDRDCPTPAEWLLPVYC
jgi:hypothetical protein